ncbi:sigma factor-like helix-turn-helix DNA-binding protein [Pseudomonas antarctica]|uniref:sigma factor-like helix-turn-helix DNA-binding protein n=1 Tax=Pseudomonas antarctica TaxID=219572 RepID=UPI00387ABF84
MSGADTSHSDYVGGLFRSHYDGLCSRLQRHLDSRAHAEAIAADAFVQLLSSPGVVPVRQPRAVLNTIDQSLDGLPAKVKATFLLSQLNGLTYPQIAAELGISRRSVSDYRAHALNLTRRLQPPLRPVADRAESGALLHAAQF